MMMKGLFLLALQVAFTNGLPQTVTSTNPKVPSFLGPFGSILSGLDINTPRANIEARIVSLLPKATLANLEIVKPTLRETAKRTVARYGPYTLVGKGKPKPSSLSASLDPNGEAFLNTASNGFCKNCTILIGKSGLVFEDGSEAGPAQGIYVHHILSRDISKSPNLPVKKCGNDQSNINPIRRNSALLGSEFLAQGDDAGKAATTLFTSNDGKYNSGFFVGPKDTFLIQADLVNYNAENKNVYVSIEMEYIDGNVGSDAVATLMSVTGCRDPEPGKGSAINLSKTGPAITNSTQWPILANGRIIAGWGHMHDGGSKMVLYLNGQPVCTSVPTYGKGGENNEQTITEMSKCTEGIPIKEGDVLTMSSEYDLAKHPLRNGGGHNALGMADVMGMFYLTFAMDSAGKP